MDYKNYNYEEEEDYLQEDEKVPTIDRAVVNSELARKTIARQQKILNI